MLEAGKTQFRGYDTNLIIRVMHEQWTQISSSFNYRNVLICGLHLSMNFCNHNENEYHCSGRTKEFTSDMNIHALIPPLDFNSSTQSASQRQAYPNQNIMLTQLFAAIKN